MQLFHFIISSLKSGRSSVLLDVVVGLLYPVISLQVSKVCNVAPFLLLVFFFLNFFFLKQFEWMKFLFEELNRCTLPLHLLMKMVKPVTEISWRKENLDFCFW